MSAERYKITNADHGAIRISHPSAHLPHEFICIHPGADPWSAFSHGVIQQQQRELAALQQVISDQVKVIDDLEHSRVKVCDENDRLLAELAAAVAERDEARAAYQVRNTEWHQHELIALVLAERYKLRAEQAEACLAAIDGAPVLCKITGFMYDGDEIKRPDWKPTIPPIGTELIARPAKD